MFNIQRLFCVILLVISVRRNNAEFPSDFVQLNAINVINVINDGVFRNWTGNHECLNELNSIKNGLISFEKWAITLVDSWGKFPSGVLRSNNYELGSFSECFHIKRNGIGYRTQYCIVQFKYRSGGEQNQEKYTRRDISIGICLPAVCSNDHLESVANKILHRIANNVTVSIPSSLCQFEENANNFNAIDLVTIVLLGIVVFLMAISTAYDILYTLNNGTKYQPFLTFSVYTNGAKLFAHTKNTTETIDCIHGIRGLSTLWIILHHVLLMYEVLPSRDRTKVFAFQETYRYLVANSMIAVDSFFTISGLLASWKMFKLDKDRRLNILSLYIHRYLRLTPLVLVSLLITMSVQRFFGSGPFWKYSMKFWGQRCERYWWSTLLYIQNYVNPNEICIPQSWYLSADMQLFIIAPFLVYAIRRFKLMAFFALFATIFISVGYTLAIYVKYDITVLDTSGGIQLIDYPTHIRFPPWIIGFITGFLFIKYPKQSIQIPKTLNWCAWAISLATLAIVLFTDPLQQFSDSKSIPLVYGLHWSIGHIFWSIALCYIIFACVHDSGGPINCFLSHPFWHTISKLSFSIYLIHYQLLSVSMFSLKSPLEFSEILLWQNYFGICVLSIFLATIATLALELPIDVIDKWIFTPSKRTRKIH